MRNFLRGCFIGVVVVIILCFVARAHAKDGKTDLPFTVDASLNKNTFTIGEPIVYNIALSASKDFDLEISGLRYKDEEAVLALKDSSVTPKASLNKNEVAARYVFYSYTVGKSTLPAAALQYKRKNDKNWSEYVIPAREVEIKSVLPEGQKEVELRDVKPPVKTSKIKYLAGVFSLFFMAALFFLWRKHFLTHKAGKAPTKKRPAHEIAYERLDQLQRKELIRQGMLKEYFSEISDIIRNYLELRFDFHAPEMTTEEFMANVKDSPQLIKTHKELLKEFLLSCDLVKFAKYTPKQAEIDMVYQGARTFIDRTKEEVAVGIT